MKKILQIFISMPFMAVALIIYAIAMAIATFIENDYGAPVARYLIYNAWWFELIQLVLAINFIGNIFKYKLYKKAKFSILLFHLAFIVMLLGAGITRYIGYEGTISIREGESSNIILSEKSYLRLINSTDESNQIINEKLFVSPFLKNKFDKSFESNGQQYNLKLLRVLPNAEKKFIADPAGHPYLEIVFASRSGKLNYYIEDKSEIKFQNQIFSLTQASVDSAVIFTIENKQPYIKSPYDLKIVSMTGGKDTILLAGEKHSVQPLQLYGFKDIQFVIKDYSEKALLSYETGNVEGGINYNLLEFNMQLGNENKKAYVPYIKGEKGEEVSVKLNNQEFFISYGSKEIELPFELKLRDFQLERYPGSQSPSSFASEVTLIDKDKSINKDYRIFMNNILEYGGFRFYQSSYDMDEKGTILSVNHDKLGTTVTYFGYLMLALGMIWSLFSKNTHFSELIKKSSELRKKRLAAVIILFLGLSGHQLFAQQQEVTIDKIDKEHSKLFGTVMVHDGRIKPFNTLSSEFLRKVARKEEFEGLNSNQVMIGMMFNPEYWQNVKMIKVGNDELKRIIGMDGKYVAFNELVNFEKGEYKLKSYVDRAYEKKASERDKFDKEVIHVDERLNLCYQVYTGQFLKIFPVPDDLQHKWITPTQTGLIKDSTQRMFTAMIFSEYYGAMVDAQKTNNWKKADEIVNSIKEFQKKYAAETIPSETKVKLEIQYVNVNVFERIFMYYGLFGFILLIILFIEILKPNIKIKVPIIILTILLGLLFLLHTYGLGLRWYIAGRAPWSNGYESMIFVGWAAMLAGFIFVKKTPIALAATSLLASILLMVAHLNWMDPEISNLVPVLKSYWLTIHVSVITSSYAFLGLGAFLGLFTLLLMILKTGENASRLDLTIGELTNVNHMTLIIGLYLLTIGTFLGAVWANESWGRYWGWDPKETWALITIIVYSFVIHSRFIPAFNKKYTFNLLSLFAFSSVLMTYFGVNYYLSGLHSYAKGDPVPIPEFVPITVGIIIMVAIIAYFRNKVKSSVDDTL